LNSEEDKNLFSLSLFLCKRNIELKSYFQKIEYTFDYASQPQHIPTYQNLIKFISEKLEIEIDNISCAKFLPHRFEWQEIHEITIQGKKKNQKKKKKKNFIGDLKKQPYFLRDGGIYYKTPYLFLF
jgi:hypothetical protein